jgi:hypothetical protein
MHSKTILSFREKVNTLISNKKFVEDEITRLKERKKGAKKDLASKVRSLEFIKIVSIQTQSQLEVHLSDMVSAGLNTVFDDPYGFAVKFEDRRSKIECDLFFKKGKELVDPLRFSGLGATDVAALSLRCAAWSMDKQYRNVLLLDEPLKHLKGKEENKRAIKLMKVLSEKLNLQIICINDERASREDILEYADRVFEVSTVPYRKWKKSKIKQL